MNFNAAMEKREAYKFKEIKVISLDLFVSKKLEIANKKRLKKLKRNSESYYLEPALIKKQ